MVLKIAEVLRRSCREDKGFTLIELLIVLAIIGILVAIGIPVYNTTMQNAAKKAHDSNLRMIDSAVQQFLAGQNDYPTEIGDLKTKGYMDEIPEIPALITSDLLKDTDYDLNGGYTIKKEGEVPWAQPIGDWKGAYRNPEGGGEETAS